MVLCLHPRVLAGISERADGSLAWHNALPVDKRVLAGRQAFFQTQGIDPARVVSAGLVHGIRVFHATESDAGAYVRNHDALMTDVPGLVLSVTAADCPPVYCFDPARGAVAMAHAGRKGMAAGVLENVVAGLVRAFGTDPADLLATVGPHIGPCHYDVSSDVAAAFDPSSVRERDGRLFLDLAAEAAIRLRAVGVRSVSADARCTFCHADRFFSARHDQTEPVLAMAAYISLV